MQPAESDPSKDAGYTGDRRFPVLLRRELANSQRSSGEGESSV